MNKRWAFFAFAILFVLSLVMVSCSANQNEDPPKKDDSAVVGLEVVNDDFFNFQNNRQIGEVFFSDSKGPVGSPVKVVVSIYDIARFDDTPLDVELVLENPDLIKLDDFEIRETIDGGDDRYEFTWYTPQVRTIPSVLTFLVTLSVEDENGDYFEAEGHFQFYINQGTPAT